MALAVALSKYAGYTAAAKIAECHPTTIALWEKEQEGKKNE